MRVVISFLKAGIYTGFFIVSIHFSYATDKDYSYQKYLDQANSQKVYQDRYWALLLHLDDNDKVIEGKGFYLSNKYNLKFSPKNELEATLKGMYSVKSLNANSHTICLFPARTAWLKKELSLTNLPKPTCSAYQEYQQKVNVTKAYLMFAGEDLTNPTSMMGHIFLKFDTKLKKSYALSFITILDKNPLKLIYQSFISGGKGQLTLQPFQKVLDNYVIQQERNVWQYPLQMDKEQLKTLSNVLWELKDVNAGYNFIYHNCGSVIFNTLKIALPTIHKEQLKAWSSPLEYTRYLYQQNALKKKKVKVYLSNKYFINTLINHLEDKQSIADLLTLKTTTFKNKQEEALSINLAKAIMVFKLKNKDISLKTLNNFNQYIEQEYSEIDKQFLDFSNYKNPIKSNTSSKVKLSYESVSNNLSRIKIGMMPIDSFLEEDQKEYFSQHELRMGYMEMSITKQKNEKVEFNLSRFDILYIKNLVTTDYTQGLSYKFRFGTKKEYTKKLKSYNALGLEFALGHSIKFFNDITLYYLLGGQYHFDDNKHQNNLLTKIELGAIIEEAGNMKSLFKVEKIHNSRNNFNYYDIKFTQAIQINPQINLNLSIKNTHSTQFNDKQSFLNKKNDTLGFSFIYSF